MSFVDPPVCRYEPCIYSNNDSKIKDLERRLDRLEKMGGKDFSIYDISKAINNGVFSIHIYCGRLLLMDNETMKMEEICSYDKMIDLIKRNFDINYFISLLREENK